MAAYDILFDRIGVDGPAVEQDRGFGFMAQLLDGEDAMNVYHVVRVPDDAVELFLDVSPCREEVTSTWWPVTFSCMEASFALLP